MVLEALISPFRAEKKPWEMFFLGMLYSSIAIFISLLIFSKEAGLVSVFLTVFACIPLIYQATKIEEAKDRQDVKESFLLKEHSKALFFFFCLFIGIMVSYTLWYLVLPTSIVSNLFSIQMETIGQINRDVTGNFLNPEKVFPIIFLNNMKVLVFCILFSFFYGFGSLFILTWNASVIAAAVGNYVRDHLSSFASIMGFTKIAIYLQYFSLGILRYMTHGFAEILAYFIAGLAGGIISIAVVNHDFRSENFEKIIIDSTSLVLISIVILFLAALIEVYITPLIF